MKVTEGLSRGSRAKLMSLDSVTVCIHPHPTVLTNHCGTPWPRFPAHHAPEASTVFNPTFPPYSSSRAGSVGQSLPARKS